MYISPLLFLCGIVCGFLGGVLVVQRSAATPCPPCTALSIEPQIGK